MDFTPRPIDAVAKELGLGPEDYELYGRGKAKLELSLLDRPARAKGRLVLVTAINPTPAGEGKTTTSISLAMGMRRLGKNAVLALREPSLGPVFGVKGGGTGGGKASLTPADDINLHFTGDIHAITTAHNLLSALADNTAYFGDVVADKGELDPRQISWGRALDMNDRFLRKCILGLGGKASGIPREERFDITAASEIMAIMALASNYKDLEERLSRIVIGQTYDGKTITAGDIQASSAMTAVLRDALKPNLVQTQEGGPAIVHCGPFGNIAHGCNSILATRLAMNLGDYAITEAGFGFDLGGEKFLDIKCRTAGIWPRAVVIVATLRALKMHGGAPIKTCGEPDVEHLKRGIEHLEKHLETAYAYGLKPIVAINVFPNDVAQELEMVEHSVASLGARLARSEGFSKGGEGAIELAKVVSEVVDATDAAPPEPKYAYELEDSAHDKIHKVARTVYGAKDVLFTAAAEKQLQRIRELGYGKLPVCMAKTQMSLTDDPAVHGRPRDFTITVREVRLSAGAGFLVALTGDVMTMPGLPKVPASRSIRLLPDGTIKGLMQND
ncbi:Formate--tetrahydrofolate ligase [Labilithrix luteola]|uniref:Formate--tetrahydrofolate ligase n=1 Tax=Labilithrix luteola TaxID=1391654 RepID=A0A0K1PRP9_9BACT|nr:formate--tetrahydrofolate ligase [Labilithrix luteola]AKU96066.1 Formate--tetrahydrofolate ligase [Labilithrix luteola]